MDYLKINKKSWNQRTEVHYDSDFYDNKTFIEGRNSLNEIELDLLGNTEGKTVLHLQCHFGQDTISLNKMGAIATGVDLSDKAIEKANELAEITKSDVTFICCDIYDLPQHLNQKFDMVFTSYGTIGWLPNIHKWAAVISHFLKPGGRFIMADFHPLVWMYDDDFKEITYRYFNDEAIVEIEEGTYADKDSTIKEQCVTWNHGLGEIINSLIKNGLIINDLQEYDYSPYNCFDNVIEAEPGRFRVEKFGNKIPMVYSIVASKKQYLL